MTEADPYRKHLARQPYRKIDEHMLVANILTSLEELEQTLPPDTDEDDDPEDEPDSADLVACKKRVNKLRRELRGLKHK